jgi:hypothetical protein
MIWGYIYIGMIAAVAITVLWIGDRECRLAMLTLVSGSALTLLAVFASGSYFDSLNILLVSLDFVVLAAFVALALFGRRFWTLDVAALQLITCTTHIAKALAPEIVPDVYSAGQGFWAYWQMLLILTAAVYARAFASREKQRNEPA